MKGIDITFEAITEYHGPPPYKYYPAIRVEMYEVRDGSRVSQLSIHRCEDIHGATGFDNKSDAFQYAEEFLDSNYKRIMQEIISSIGE